LLVLPSMPEEVLLFFMTRFKKKAVWKTTFVSGLFNTDKFQLTKCFALKKSPKHTVDYLIDSFKHAHFCINANVKMCLKPKAQPGGVLKGLKHPP